MRIRLSALVIPFFATLAFAQTRISDVVYMKSGGAAFTMDVIKPAKPNKAAVVVMVSGGWISDHAMVPGFGKSLEKSFTESGFTTFLVVHGAEPRYKVAEIVNQVQTAVRYIHQHADDYGIDTNRVGVTGISSGGHLSLMIAGSPESPVNAVCAIAPPTDLANWGKADHLFTEESNLTMFLAAIGADPKAERADTISLVQEISPITYANPKFPPCLIVHGDKDFLVPIQQAQVMDAALEKLGVEHRLDIVKDGNHDDSTFVPGLAKALEWFKLQLLK